MPKPPKSQYVEIIDDIYLAYLGALSAKNDADLADVLAEYIVPTDGETANGGDDAQQPSVAAPQPQKNFRHAA